VCAIYSQLPNGLPIPKAGNQRQTQPFVVLAEKAPDPVALRLTYQQNQFSNSGCIETKCKRLKVVASQYASGEFGAKKSRKSRPEAKIARGGLKVVWKWA
jgi:hypothetical protein